MTLLQPFARNTILLGLFALGLLRPLMGQSAAAEEQPGDDRILRVQLFLDASEFKPGVVDGRWGEFTRKALARYDKASNRQPAEYGEQPPATFKLPLDESRPLLREYQFTAEDEELLGQVPDEPAQQAEKDRLPYEDLLELAAEKFHTTRDFLKEANPDFDWSKAKAGDKVRVPNVAEPFSMKKVREEKQEIEKAAADGSIVTEGEKPPDKQFKIEISTKDKILELYQAGKLVGSYPITPGSENLPAPVGEWHVKGFAWMPTFRWDEAMLQSGKRSDDAFVLPPGPNNPVGVLWMELNHDGSGIHGTSVPETIGRTTSHGCIRLSNWDVLHLAQKVQPGIKVTIQ